MTSPRKRHTWLWMNLLVALSLLAFAAPAAAQCPDLDLLGCGDVAYEGCCDGNALYWCEDGVLLSLSCGDNPSCGWDGELQYYDCGTAGDAEPSGLYPQACPVQTLGPPVVVNEVLLDDEADNAVPFVELKGEPGLDLSCFEVVTYDRGMDGDECTWEDSVDLSWEWMPLDGYLLVAADSELVGWDVVDSAARLPTTPGAVGIVYHGESSDVLVDSVAWGGDDDWCDPPFAESWFSPALLAAPASGESLARYPDGLDTDDNTDDFRACETPSPGDTNRCPGPNPGFCTGLQLDESVVINEVLYWPGSTQIAFIELKGTPGLDLTCLSLVGINGGEDGSQCAPYNYIPLWFEEMPGDGYFLIAADTLGPADLEDPGADLQNGPDGLALVYEKIDDIVFLDTLSYGGLLPACNPRITEGIPAPLTPQGESLARVPDGQDTGSNGIDFVTCESPTPGTPNDCPDVVVGDCPPLGTPPALIINEVLYRPQAGSTAAFIELKGPASLSLDCYQLVATNGATASGGCTPYATIRLDDRAIDENGYLVVGATTGVPNYVFTDPLADLQNGPDAVRLVYRTDAGEETILDRIAYGAELAECEPALAEGSPAADAGYGESLSRIPDGADTDDNSADLKSCETPTPGAANSCPQPPVCNGQPAEMVINELLYRTSTSGDPAAFVELKGPAGTDLSCYHLLGYDLDAGCPLYRDVRLTGTIPDDGYFVVGKSSAVAAADQIDPGADFKTGPAGTVLVYRHDTQGDIQIDSVGYRAIINECPFAEGDPHIGAEVDESLARMPDGTDTAFNKDDFVACPTPTPGAPNECGEPVLCLGPVPEVVINEALVTPTAETGPAYVEIRGPAGTELDCFELVGRNGDGCGDYGRVPLRGQTIPEDGYFVVAAGEGLGDADLVHTGASYDAGPDAIELRYMHTVDGTRIADALAYGATDSQCVGGEGGPAEAPAEGTVLARVPDGTDTDDNASDFEACAVLTPGAANPASVSACGGGEPPDGNDTVGADTGAPPADTSTGGGGGGGGGCAAGGRAPLAPVWLLLGLAVFFRRRGGGDATECERRS